MVKKSLKLNAILSSIKTVLSMVISLVTFPYISRVLQVEAVGKHDFAVSIVKYFVLLAELGVFTYAVREGTKLREERSALSKFASEIFTLQTFAAVISTCLLVVLMLTVSKMQEYWLLLLILCIQIPLTAFSRSWIYNVYEDFGYITVTQVLFQIVALAVMFLFVRSPSDVYVYTITYVISHAGANLLHGLRSRKYMDVRLVGFGSIRRHIKPILIIFSTTISISIYVNSDVTILGWLIDDEAVGYYSVAVKVYNIIKQVITAVLTVTIPRLTLYAGTERFKPFFNRVLKIMALIILPAMTGLFLLSDNVVEIIGGSEYLEATNAMRILSVALGASLFACLYASGVLIPNMLEKVFLKATIISAVVNILLNFVLIPLFQQDAAAFTTLVAEMLMLVICYCGSRKFVPLEDLGKTLLAIFAGCLVIVAICVWICSVGLPLYVETVLCVAVSVLAYCVVQVVMKNEIFIEALQIVKRKFVNKGK